MRRKERKLLAQNESIYYNGGMRKGKGEEAEREIETESGSTQQRRKIKDTQDLN